MKNTRLQQQLIDELDSFLYSRKSLMLSTVDKHQNPHSSYAPFSVYENNILIFVSQLAAHTQHLINVPVASILLIEDEGSCSNIFARKRLTYQVVVEAIPRNSSIWSEAIDNMTQRLGDQMILLSSLDDFILFQLQPTSGRYVKGFGQAYELEGEDLLIKNIKHLRQLKDNKKVMK